MTQPSEEARKAAIERVAAYLMMSGFPKEERDREWVGCLDAIERRRAKGEADSEIGVLQNMNFYRREAQWLLDAVDAPRVPPSGEALNDAAYDAAWRAAFPHLPGEVRGNIESGVEGVENDGEAIAVYQLIRVAKVKITREIA